MSAITQCWCQGETYPTVLSRWSFTWSAVNDIRCPDLCLFHLFFGCCSEGFFTCVSSESLCHCTLINNPPGSVRSEAPCQHPASFMSNYCLQTFPHNNTASAFLKDTKTVYEKHRCLCLQPRAASGRERLCLGEGFSSTSEWTDISGQIYFRGFLKLISKWCKSCIDYSAPCCNPLVQM